MFEDGVALSRIPVRNYLRNSIVSIRVLHQLDHAVSDLAHQFSALVWRYNVLHQNLDDNQPVAVGADLVEVLLNFVKHKVLLGAFETATVEHFLDDVRAL